MLQAEERLLHVITREYFCEERFYWHAVSGVGNSDTYITRDGINCLSEN